MEKFKDGFSRNYNFASQQFEFGHQGDRHRYHTSRENQGAICAADHNLRLANNKADDLTIRKLTWGNKTHEGRV